MPIKVNQITSASEAGIGQISSSTDNAIVRWDGTGGQTVQDSGVTIDDSDVVTVPSLTASRVVQTDGSQQLESSSVTTTELGYVSGVTSALQTQLDAKIDDFSSSTDNRLVRTDGTAGEAIQDSGISIDDSDNVTIQQGSVDTTISKIAENTADANQAGSLVLQASNKTAGTGDGGDVEVTAGTSSGGTPGEFKINAYTTTQSFDISGTTVQYFVENTNTVDGFAGFFARIPGTSTGDVKTTYDINGVQAWSIGIDNSDGDRFKWNADTDLSSPASQQIFALAASGAVYMMHDSAADLLWETDGAGDIGADGANRPAAVYVEQFVKVASASSGSSVQTIAQNTSATASSDANMHLTTATSGGDPYLRLNCNGNSADTTDTYVIGLDESDSGKLIFGSRGSIGNVVSSSREDLTILNDGTAMTYGRDDDSTAHTMYGSVTITGALDHNGSTAGFFGTTPASQQGTISDPAGGATVDSEARTAINAILDLLQAYGLMA